ncbi:hypothetical protein BYT27DRAFT_7250526 [Phlegmacium glaucopus]|nr:hypothetical protein BYT27DRAFT_7250526 [Phlegmacium glaucopus]
MALIRRVVLNTTRSTTILLTQRRAASSSHDHGHHQEEHHDSTVYPPEGFGNAFWRNVLLLSLVGAATYKYAPRANDDLYLTQWIKMYMNSRDHWLALNAKHTAQQMEVSHAGMLLSDAQRPAVHRFRYPQSLVQSSPFLNAVGSNVDMEGVVLRGEKEFD